MGNPCLEFKEARSLMVGICSQLTTIDGVKVLPSERILAEQNLKENVKQLELFIEQENKRKTLLTKEQREEKFSKEKRK